MSFQLLQYARTLALSSRKTPSGKLAESLALYHPMVIEEQQITDNSTRALCFIPETNACCMYIYERYGRLYIMHDIHSPLHDDTSRGVFNKRVLLDACEMKFQSILNQSYMQDYSSLLPTHLTKRTGWRALLNFVRDNHLLLPEQLVNYQTRSFSPKNLYDLVYDIKDKLVVFSRTPAAFNIYLKTALSSDLDMFVILNDNIKAVKGMQFPGVLHSLTLADTRRCDMLDSILRIEPKLVDSKVQRILKENEDLMVFEKQCEPATLFLYLARYFWRDGAMMNTTTFKRMILDDCHMTNFAIEAMKAWHRCSDEDKFNLCFDLALFGTARELRFLNIDPTTVRDGDRDVLFDVFGR